MNTRTVTIVNGQTGQESEVKLAEGATPLAILRQLGLPHPEQHRLARVVNRHVLLPNTDVSSVVKDRERLFVFAAIEVGRPAWAC